MMQWAPKDGEEQHKEKKIVAEISMHAGDSGPNQACFEKK